MKTVKSKKKRTGEDWLVDIISYTLLIFITITIILPFMQVVTISMSPSHVVNESGFHIIPTEFDFSGYKQIATNPAFWDSYLITILRTVIGTACCVFVTVLTAYPLAKSNLPYRKYIMMFIVFTMYFSGGMIPTYILIKNLGLMNNFLVYILPQLITGFALIITRNFFMGIPAALEEAAKIDGASNMRVLFGIYLPISLPVLATISLWYAVTHWNSWMDNMLYVTNEKLYVVQYVLQRILSSGKVDETADFTNIVIHTETMKMAALILTLLPIVCVYPFLQKYFVKGMTLGSVKE